MVGTTKTEAQKLYVAWLFAWWLTGEEGWERAELKRSDGRGVQRWPAAA